VSPLLAPSRRQLETQLDALLERHPEARILGVRSPIRRPWPDSLERHGRRFRLAWCETELAVREALTRLEEQDSEALLLVTPLQETQLAADVVARLPRARLLAASRWDALRTVFRARDLDPRLRGLEGLCDLLIERSAITDYPPAAGGVLDLDTAWRICLEHVVGLPAARADVDALLAWTAGDENLDRFQTLSSATRDQVLARLAADGGSAAALAIRAVSAGRGSDALAVGLVCGVIYSDGEPNGALREAAVRLEPMLGDARIEHAAGLG
jgi:hypothetical protein